MKPKSSISCKGKRIDISGCMKKPKLGLSSTLAATVFLHSLNVPPIKKALFYLRFLVLV